MGRFETGVPRALIELYGARMMTLAAPEGALGPTPLSSDTSRQHDARSSRAMLALLSACSTLHAAPRAARAVVPPRAVSPLMASWTAADMKSKRLRLPEEVRRPALH